ncbi:MAG: hypothetical protein A2049_11120 [Elusimicrobia bacterium GWA2_62_23]|nr:MAG: hypothetical protein A2049_11120 [Elusimicrobia bacterium GWA2_62_23]OGR68978.1 MAG: hypothetical protein A2179_00310 [Elusimicrobia bacterium GWC2_63_65]
MIKETLSKIEAAIAKIQAGESAEKAELVALLKKLKDELATLPESRIDEVRSIGYFTETAAHEVTRENANVQLKNLSISGISYAVKGFEASHPQMVGVVNEICMILARMGI